MKVAILAPVHAYDDIRVFRKEAVTLAAAGNDVTLYARTPDGSPLRDSGVRVEPVSYRNRLQRFALLPRLAHAAVKQRADIYHLHNPDTLPIAFWLRLRGRRVVYDTHEDFRTEIMLRRWLPAALRRPAAAAVSAAESVAGRTLDAVIVTQEQITRRIPRAVVIGNPPIVDAAAARAAADTRAERDSGPRIVLGYVGGISADRGLFRMLDLVAAMDAERPTRLLLIGYPVNDDALQRAQELPQWRLVDFAGRLPQEQAFRELAAADVGLILFEDVASHGFIDPNKIYEYMALGLPFVATGFPDWQSRIGPARAGLFLQPGQSVAAAAVEVLRFAADRAELAAAGRRGAEYVVGTYSWQAVGAPALLGLYRRVRQRRTRSAFSRRR